MSEDRDKFDLATFCFRELLGEVANLILHPAQIRVFQETDRGAAAATIVNWHDAEGYEDGTPVLAPEHRGQAAARLSGLHRMTRRALIRRGCSTLGEMNQLMPRSAEQLVRLVAKSLGAGGINRCKSPIIIDRTHPRV
jgi:hypothetical protein